MLRSVVGASVVAAFAAALALAQSDKKDREVQGALKKVDADGGTLTVAVKTGKETAEKEFSVADSTKVVVFEGDDRRQWTGKKGLKDDAIKAGRHVVVVSGDDGRVTLVRVGFPRVSISGTLEKIDADQGTLTVAVKGKEGKEPASKKFTVTKASRVVLVNGKDRKEVAGKDGLKDDLVKEGAEVAVVTEGGRVVRVRIGAPAKKE